METKPIRFYDEPITVYFAKEPTYEKTPPCPQGFHWRDVDYQVTQVFSEWRDYHRQGKMARNMAPEHAQRSTLRGSWGVGKYFFIVEVQDQRIFEIYYDRAPKNVSDRKGKWFLRSEQQKQTE